MSLVDDNIKPIAHDKLTNAIDILENAATQLKGSAELQEGLAQRLKIEYDEASIKAKAAWEQYYDCIAASKILESSK